MQFEVSCYVTGNTYNPVLTVQEVSTSVARSRCLKAWELLLGTLAGVHLDHRCSTSFRAPSSSHHNAVLKFNSTCTAEKKDTCENVGMYNYYYITFYNILNEYPLGQKILENFPHFLP